MRNCLDKENEKEFSGYHSKFNKLVDHEIEIKLKQLLIFNTFMNEFIKNPANNPAHEAHTKILHNEFIKINDGQFNLKDFKKTALYPIFKEWFFPTNDPNIPIYRNDSNKNKKINNIISKTPEEEYIVKAQLLHFCMNWIMGKATTSANPGQNFNIILSNFGL
jgi:hypothetical protein